MNLRNLFKRRRPAERETAPQVTAWERRLAETPSAPSDIAYSTYNQMERDSMVQTVLTVKKLGILAVPYHIEPSGDARRDRFVAEAFERMEGSPLSVLYAAMDAFAKGWSVQEMVFAEDGGKIWLTAVRSKDPSLFGLLLDPFGKTTGLKLQIPGETDRDLPIGKFVVYRYRGGYGRPKGRSDLDAAYPHWQAKQGLSKAWHMHLAKFAMPVMVARCGPSVSSADRALIVQALNDLDKNSSIVVPQEVEIESIGGNREASSAFMDAIDFQNREIARAVLGQTLATDEGRRVGSLAMGKVHLQVLTLQLEASRKELADVVMTEQVVRPIVELNFGPGPIPRFAFDPVELDAFTTGKL